jgi:acetyl-CoA synthetase
LRKIVSGEAKGLGDQSTLANAEVIEPIIVAVEKQYGVKN